MKKLLLSLTCLFVAIAAHAGFTDSLSVGFGMGYTNYQNIKGEIYLKKETVAFNRLIELKIGMNRDAYSFTFDKVEGLDATSIGFYADMCIYPFKNGIYTGFRWDAITFNTLTDEAKAKINHERSYTATSLYTGSNMHLQLGYKLNLGKRSALKFYGLAGLQQFKISNGSSSSGSYVQATNPNIIIEEHFEFIYSGNIGFEMRF